MKEFYVFVVFRGSLDWEGNRMFIFCGNRGVFYILVVSGNLESRGFRVILLKKNRKDKLIYFISFDLVFN